MSLSTPWPNEAYSLIIPAAVADTVPLVPPALGPLPAAPRSPGHAEPPIRQEPGLAPDYRMNYLRSASVNEVEGFALAGLIGLAGMILVGGVVGHRQAKAGLVVRAVGTARFLK